MKFIDFNPDIDNVLKNQFVSTYGLTGSGKSTFALTGDPDDGPTVFLPFDPRSYSARVTAVRDWGARIIIPDGIGISADAADGNIDMNKVLKKSEAKKKASSGKSYKVWTGDQDTAKQMQKVFRELCDHMATCPRSEAAVLAVDDAKWLGSIWVVAETGMFFGGATKKDYGEIYKDLGDTLSKLQRHTGCDKDVILTHHYEEKWAKGDDGEREPTGTYEPKWVSRVPKLSDVVLEHFITPLDHRYGGGKIGIRFTHKLPADAYGLFGHELIGADQCRFSYVKTILTDAEVRKMHLEIMAEEAG